MSTQIINAAIAASIADENNTANTVGGKPTFYGCPVVSGLSGGISRRYEGTRFVQARGVEISSLQGVFIIEGAGVEAGRVEAGGVEALGVRLAEVRLCKSSRTGRTSWPALVEEGWVPGFRADQVPSPAALRGLDRFVVFPVSSTGNSDWQAEVVDVAEWTEAVAAWEAWRQQEGSLPASTEGAWRLARNHTRRETGWWTAQEVMDLLRYADDAVIEDHGDEGMIFWSASRNVCGWASSRILDPSSGEVAETWPLGLRTLPGCFSRDGLTIESLQVIDNKLHWKILDEAGCGIYVECHDYTVWNGSPRPPFSDGEWLAAIKTEFQHERLNRVEKALSGLQRKLEDVISVTADDEEY